MHVDEAMQELDKYLDDAYLAHLPKVRIIHGRGTGALKSAVQTMLRRNKHGRQISPRRIRRRRIWGNDS